MLVILIASFVVACSLIALVTALLVIREERQIEADENLVLAAEPLRPEWIYGRRMDVPKKYPALRTRNAKALR